MPLKSICNRNVGFIEQKMYFWTLQRVSSKKNSIKQHYFCAWKKISVDLFRAAPYMFMLVLHKDALFNWISKFNHQVSTSDEIASFAKRVRGDKARKDFIEELVRNYINRNNGFVSNSFCNPSLQRHKAQRYTLSVSTHSMTARSTIHSIIDQIKHFL